VNPPRTSPPSFDLADSPDVLARFHQEIDLVDINARQVARRIAAHTVTLDDLRSFGHEGLLYAARSFEESHHVPFRRWANLRIRGAMIDGVRKWGNLPRRIYRELRAMAAADALQGVYDEEYAPVPSPTAEQADERIATTLTSLATALAVGSAAGAIRDGEGASDSGASPEEMVANAELVARVRGIMARMPDVERALIERHYFGDETLDQAAGALGLSKSWGSRLHARAIETIARAMREEL